MKIGMILNDPFPPDIRVEKEVRSLIAGGHRVTLLACARPAEPLGSETVSEAFEVHRIQDPRGGTLRRRLRHIWFQFALRDIYWSDRVREFAQDTSIDALHVHDLPLVGTAIPVARDLRIPLIADLHENYPATMELRKAHTPHAVDRLIISPPRWYAYERRVIHDADHVIVVVDEARDRLIRMHGLPSNRISVVMNTQETGWTSPCAAEGAASRERDADSFIVTYVGAGGPHRGLETAVAAMEHVKVVANEIRLRIVGIRGPQRDALRALAVSLGVADRVEIVGWQPFDEVQHEILSASVCLVPHNRNPHTDTTIPHKLFQYMLLERPVVVSDCRPLARIVETTGAGLVFRSGDPRDLADRIRTLYERRDLGAEAARRGRAAVLERYNWEIDGARLCDVYERLESLVRV